MNWVELEHSSGGEQGAIQQLMLSKNNSKERSVDSSPAFFFFFFDGERKEKQDNPSTDNNWKNVRQTEADTKTKREKGIGTILIALCS